MVDNKTGSVKQAVLPAVFEKEKKFNDLVMEWNRKMNLVSRKKHNVYDLINESKIFFDYVDFKINPRVMDLGTGGGFPGIVLKIHYPGIELTLVDSIKKKTKALLDIIHRLGFDNVEVICSRVEELGKLEELRRAFDYVTARAVSSLDRLVMWSRTLLKPGAKLITVKGENIEKEIKEAQKHRFIRKIDVFERNDKKVVVVEFK